MYIDKARRVDVHPVFIGSALARAAPAKATVQLGGVIGPVNSQYMTKR
jgi:hypothetical protein